MLETYDVVIIGGGLAGTAVAYELGKHKLKSLIIELRDAPAAGASGNEQGLIVPYLTAAETTTQELYEEAFHQVTSELNELHSADLLPSLRKCGAVQFASSLRPQKIHEALKNGTKKNPRAHGISAEDLCDLLHTKVKEDALFYPDALVLSPPELCRLWSHHDILIKTEALTLSRKDDVWEVFTHSGVQAAKAQSIVIANAFDAAQFSQTSWLTLEKIRGQILCLPAEGTLQEISTAVCFDGYLLPAYKNSVLIGASYDHHFLDPEISEGRTNDMVARLQRRLPELTLPALHKGNSRVSFRTSTHDRLPYVGQLPDYSWAQKERPLWSRLSENDIPLLPNIFVSVGHGSRGLLSGFLAAKLISGLIVKSETPQSYDRFNEMLAPLRLLNRIIKREELTR